MNDFFAHSVATWTLPGGIEAHGEDDQRRLSQFLKAHPVIEQAIAQRIANLAWTPPTPSAASLTASPEGRTGPQTVPTGSILPSNTPFAASHPRVAGPTNLPKQPLRLSAGRAKYAAYYSSTLKSQKARTTADKGRLFDHFEEFLTRNHPELGSDPWVHMLDSSHVGGFLEDQADRPGKRRSEDGEPRAAAPKTMLKKLSDMQHFFDYLRRHAKATDEDIADDLLEASEAWRKQASDESVHYLPFTDSHVKQILDPGTYLNYNRDPDYFWGPLLGLHLGARLGEFVNAKVSNIGHLPEIDVWYIDVTPEDAKNRNSVRRLPITDALIRLGFVQYVEHVRRLGGRYLFPHRDWESKTLQNDRSKNQSRAFGNYMNKIGLTDPLLVHHSFRHTAVSAMQDAGVPLAHAMQIVGHDAQDHAIRTGRITPEQARSVHLSVYTHADLERLGTKYPILALKDALERSIKPPIDYQLLAKAATIVTEHLRKVGGEFRSGWAPQSERYGQEIRARLLG